MEFKTEAQKACYEKVSGYLKEMFGEAVIARENQPIFMTMPYGSAIAYIIVSEWGNDDASIGVRSYVVHGAEMAADLLHYLLRENDNMRFGAFGVDADNDIFFEHSIVGSTCDKNELKTSILAVLTTADHHDDLIRNKWGGETALERMTK